LDDGRRHDDDGPPSFALRHSSFNRRADLQSRRIGHSPQRGLRAVQSVAPKSMSAWLKSKTCFFGSTDSEMDQSWLIVAWLFGSPCPTNTLNSTRATLVSRIAARSRNAELPVAPARAAPSALYR